MAMKDLLFILRRWAALQSVVLPKSVLARPSVQFHCSIPCRVSSFMRCPRCLFQSSQTVLDQELTTTPPTPPIWSHQSRLTAASGRLQLLWAFLLLVLVSDAQATFEPDSISAHCRMNNRDEADWQVRHVQCTIQFGWKRSEVSEKHKIDCFSIAGHYATLIHDADVHWLPHFLDHSKRVILTANVVACPWVHQPCQLSPVLLTEGKAMPLVGWMPSGRPTFTLRLSIIENFGHYLFKYKTGDILFLGLTSTKILRFPRGGFAWILTVGISYEAAANKQACSAFD